MFDICYSNVLSCYFFLFPFGYLNRWEFYFRCLGTTQHLKSRYGSGYSLEVKLTSPKATSDAELQEAMKGLHEYIMEIFPEAVRTECFGERGVYKVPAHNVISLSATFQALDKG